MSFLNDVQEGAEEKPNALTEDDQEVVDDLEVAKDQKVTKDLEVINETEVTEGQIASEGVGAIIIKLILFFTSLI